MTELRRRFPQIRSRRWLDGRRADGSFGILWLTPGAEGVTEEGLDFSARTVSRSRLGPPRAREGTDFYRVERRTRSDHVPTAEIAGIQKLAATSEHRRR